MSDFCNKPPEGWYCKREVGHDGPCAAVPTKNMHDRDLDALIKDRPPTEFEKHMQDLEAQRRLEHKEKLASTLEEIIKKDADRLEQELHRLPLKTECCCKTTAPALPTATELLGRQAWSLKCLIQEIRSTAEALSEAGRRVNATLAVRHLEDALHRINLALPDDEQL